MLLKALSITFLSLSLTSCSSGPKGKTEKTSNVLSIQNYKNKVYFSGQPSEADFADLAKKGITTVINLRQESEMKKVGFSESDAAKKAGITYYNIPVDYSKEFEKKAVDKIETTFMKHHKKEKILLHCGSGNRAKAWFAIHVAETHDTDAETGLKKARELGLSSSNLEKKVKNYLKK